eukprot:244317_1
MKKHRVAYIIHFLTIHLFSVSTIVIWNDPMNTTTTQAYWKGNTIHTLQNNPLVSPTGICWSICSGHIYRITSTMVFEEIKLTFHVNAYNITNTSQKCIFSYSTDNSSQYHTFYEINNTTHVISRTQKLNTSTENNIAIRIKIEALNNCCYLSNIKLEGTMIPVSDDFLISNSSTTKLWNDASSFCKITYGTELATVATFYLNKKAVAICHDFCHSINLNASNCGCWIGLYRNANKNIWYWKDGTSLTQYGFLADGSARTFTAPWWTDGFSGSDPNEAISTSTYVRMGTVGETWTWGDTAVTNNYKYYPMCNAPTPSPTSVSSTPTLSPTTVLPTLSPITYFPTFSPSTSIPTLSPTTYIPTLFPTQLPSTSTFKPTIVITYITNTPTASPQRDKQNDMETSIVDIVLSTATETHKRNNKKRAALIVFVLFSVTLIIILCVLIIYFYRIRMQYKRKCNTNMNDDMDCYVELIDPEIHTTDGHSDFEVNTTPYDQMYTPLGITTFKGESMSLHSVHSNDNDDACSVVSMDVTPGNEENHLTHDHIEIENNEIRTDSCVESDMFAEKSTASGFAQILKDNVMSVDLMMDDIVQDMDTNK